MIAISRNKNPIIQKKINQIELPPNPRLKLNMKDQSKIDKIDINMFGLKTEDQNNNEKNKLLEDIYENKVYKSIENEKLSSINAKTIIINSKKGIFKNFLENEDIQIKDIDNVILNEISGKQYKNTIKIDNENLILDKDYLKKKLAEEMSYTKNGLEKKANLFQIQQIKNNYSISKPKNTSISDNMFDFPIPPYEKYQNAEFTNIDEILFIDSVRSLDLSQELRAFYSFENKFTLSHPLYKEIDVNLNENYGLISEAGVKFQIFRSIPEKKYIRLTSSENYLSDSNILTSILSGFIQNQIIKLKKYETHFDFSKLNKLYEYKAYLANLKPPSVTTNLANSYAEINKMKVQVNQKQRFTLYYDKFENGDLLETLEEKIENAMEIKKAILYPNLNNLIINGNRRR